MKNPIAFVPASVRVGDWMINADGVEMFVTFTDNSESPEKFVRAVIFFSDENGADHSQAYHYKTNARGWLNIRRTARCSGRVSLDQVGDWRGSTREIFARFFERLTANHDRAVA